MAKPLPLSPGSMRTEFLPFHVPAIGDEEIAAATEVLRYPAQQILASGWLLGEQYLANRAAVLDIALGKGHLVLFGIRPQYRGQPNATMKMFFNGLHYW